jgi:hypothetical protein
VKGLAFDTMAFWKGLQTQIAHLPVVNVSDLQKRWVMKYGHPAPDVPAWRLYDMLNSESYKKSIRFYSKSATDGDGCHAFLGSPHHLMITIDHWGVDAFEFVEFVVHIPTCAYVQFDNGLLVPLTHWGDGRFGLETQFSLPRYRAASSVCVLHFEFAEPCAHMNGQLTDPMGMQWTVLGVDAAYDDSKFRIIPVYTGQDRDNENTAFLCVSNDQIQTRNKIDTLRWIASQHMDTHSHMIDKYATVWQRCWRKRYMAREVYDHTDLPRDMCWIVGAYACGGHVEPSACNNDHDASL